MKYRYPLLILFFLYTAWGITTAGRSVDVSTAKVQNGTKGLKMTVNDLAAYDINQLVTMSQGQHDQITSCTCTVTIKKGSGITKTYNGLSWDDDMKVLFRQLKKGEQVWITNFKARSGKAQIRVSGMSVTII